MDSRGWPTFLLLDVRRRDQDAIWPVESGKYVQSWWKEYNHIDQKDESTSLEPRN